MIFKSIFEKITQAQIPLPTFEDNLKLLQFWIDQQDKWFYFETASVISSKLGETFVPAPMHQIVAERVTNDETYYYVQTRIVGRIRDVIFNPPSLMLNDANEITVQINYDRNKHTVLTRQKRKNFGLVFSQITYFEPIENFEKFIENDERVKR